MPQHAATDPDRAWITEIGRPTVTRDAADEAARRALIRRTLVRTFRPDPAYPGVKRISPEEVRALEAKLNALFTPALRAWRRLERTITAEEDVW